ncbi:HhH-GPD family protein [Solidesulfovibrio fructosivorans JJ]]|uniref:HhH-GPD family protein n=1 Tax=Solidesulfovibrio fructosivorans JJ] TaxID=596151 RepID=E1JUG8_SOLFR|nr:endonuclease [Solidesulfovibrio fructosivorans]EFL52098.1 HhH-GPD family protein [Solidesulfovibrio fructosivorans JJ]]
MKRRELFLAMHQAMLEALGPSGWWPADSAFEMAVGAILTQNTNWANVARAIDNLKAAGRFSAEALYALPVEELAELIRPAGYFRVKAARLRNLLALIVHELGGDITALADGGLDAARERLLAVKGVGPETADSILLYGLSLPSFVVDAYTARICNRHALAPEDAGYEELRELFMDALPEDTALYNEFHALLVRVGNGWCRPRAPRCDSCPLGPFLP